MNNVKKTVSLIVFPWLMLVGCSGTEVKETLGLEKQVPDEFRVVARPSLNVPPVFNLRPPASPGEVVPASDTTNQARKLVTGADAPSSASGSLDVDPATEVDTAVTPVVSGSLTSPAEASFLSKAGVDKKDPGIRGVIHSETTAVEEKKEEKNFFEKLTPSGDEQPTVNAKEERDRIEKNKKDNKAITEGETPTNDPKKKSVIDKLLN